MAQTTRSYDKTQVFKSSRTCRTAQLTICLFVLLTMLAVNSTPAAAADTNKSLQTFTLTDHLGMAWEHELVTFELNATTNPVTLQLIGPFNQNIAFQLIQRDGKQCIAFHADLTSLQTASYKLQQSHSAASQLQANNAAGIHIDQSNDYIELTNGVTGIRLHANAKNAASQGPIAGVLMPDGSWSLLGSITGLSNIKEYQATLTATGPVYAQVTTHYLFDDGSTWDATFQLNAGEPVVIIHEQMNNLPEIAQWKLKLPKANVPSHLMYRAGNDGRDAKTLQDALIVADLAVEPNPQTRYPGKDRTDAGFWQLNPWISWWTYNNAAAYQLMYLPKNTHLAKVSDGQTRTAYDWHLQNIITQETPQKAAIPSLLIAAGKAGSWTIPGRNGKNHGFTLKPENDGSFDINIPLNWPSRIWLLGSTTDKRTFYANTDVTLAHAMLIKHLDRPLDEIKELVLAWPANENLPYPQLFPSKARIKELQEQTMKLGFDSQRKRLDIKKYMLEGRTDPERAAEFSKMAIDASINSAAGYFINASPSNGSGRNAAINSSQHQIGRGVESAALAADLAFGYGEMSAADQELVRARLALAAYYIAGNDVVSPERGLAQLENMTAMLYGGLGLVAAVIPDHPMAKTWAARTAAVYEESLNNWCGPNGGWSECPHYQLASLNSFLMFGLATANSGISDFLYDERIKKSVAFLAKIASPADPRHNHTRHLPPIGNTYLNVQSDVFAIMAAIYRDRDPVFASHMQWMWEQQGKPTTFVIGGDVSIQWFNSFLYRDINPVNPNYHSEYFPLFGAVFRDAYATPNETYMVYHHGPASGHYDFDQASFEMWAKGQPLMLDWGYNGRMPAWLHNTASFASTRGAITSYISTPLSDYTKSEQIGWQRDILFIKSPKQDGPAYFVIQDDVTRFNSQSKDNALWYWFNTKENPTRHGQRIEVKGAENVTLDVWLDKQAADSLAGYDAKSWAKQQADMTEQKQPPTANVNPDNLVKTTLINTSAWEGRGQKYWQRGATIQHGLSIPVNVNQRVRTVLFPREDSQNPVKIQPLADGNGLHVIFDQGEDYLFISDETIDFNLPGQNIKFKGKTGVIQIRQNEISLILLDGQSIQYQSAALTGVEGKAISKQFSQ